MRQAAATAVRNCGLSSGVMQMQVGSPMLNRESVIVWSRPQDQEADTAQSENRDLLPSSACSCHWVRDPLPEFARCCADVRSHMTLARQDASASRASI